MTPISCADARLLGLVRYYTGKPCKHGHVCERMTVNGDCVQCARSRFLRIQKSRRPEFNARQRQWRQDNIDHSRREGRIRYRTNEKVRESCRQWAAAHPEKRIVAQRGWKKRNPDRVAADAAMRRAAQRKATPAWVDRKALLAVYRAAQVAPGLHVDHIVPLISKVVCGLHVPWNLQVIPAAENYAKNNRFEV